MNLGDIITIPTPDGDQVPALVTRVNDDSTANLRVFSPRGSDFDEVRNNVNDQGEPPTVEDAPAPADTTATTPAPVVTTPSAPAPAAPSIPDLIAQLQAALAALQPATSTPAADTSSDTSGTAAPTS